VARLVSEKIAQGVAKPIVVKIIQNYTSEKVLQNFGLLL
jgi:hypothetical protein